MIAAAIVLNIVWLGVGIVLRVALHRKRTGDSGVVAQAARGTAAWWSGLAYMVAVLLGAVAPIAQLAGVRPIEALDRSWIAVLGAVVALAALAVTFVAQEMMGASWRTGVDAEARTELVERGMFGVVRNPIYTTTLLTAFGIALVVPNPVALAGSLLFVVAIEAQVRLVEEPYLLAVHGRRYASYASAVGRFVPGIGRLRPEAAVRQSQPA